MKFTPLPWDFQRVHRQDAYKSTDTERIMDLVLPLKREFFDAIKAGTKTEEFRLKNAYWMKRLEGRTFDRVVLTLGYPSREDHERRIVKPWKGMRETTITHPLFGPEPVQVYAINVSA